MKNYQDIDFSHSRVPLAESGKNTALANEFWTTLTREFVKTFDPSAQSACRSGYAMSVIDIKFSTEKNVRVFAENFRETVGEFARVCEIFDGINPRATVFFGMAANRALQNRWVPKIEILALKSLTP